ncbi:TauD/TfdA family dioxygenase [Rhizobium laguerreae]|uniref:TauD/TfdA family dioxygenase n=1 Tax=Rhizobium laguerreae TaxID=1076926 RepID=UPI001C912C36|nr:TauD/TfdA family dioxygenase [Rhizobium laguerreae]MBY3425495.1 TauD/TfdA family dioxygenase [Rhizobium laguerreae]
MKTGGLSVVNAPQTVDLNLWIAEEKRILESIIRETGACMIRGGNGTNVSCQSILSALQVELVEDVFWSTPRRRVNGKTFTATEYPKPEEIPMHSEMSYAPRYPRILCFQALTCAETGGQTTLADLGSVSSEIADLTAKVFERGILYVRVFHEGLDIPVEKAFGVSRREDVADAAGRHGVEIEFHGRAVKVYQRSRGALTSEEGLLWFNQAQVFHPASLRRDLRSNLQSLFDDHDLPRQARYGDGSPIPDEDIIRVNNAFAKHVFDINWSPREIVLIDNLRLAHGRRSFTGDRVVHVAMGNPIAEGARSVFTI